MAKQAKTLRKEKFKAKALVRSESVKKGVSKILRLLERADVSDVSSVVHSPVATEILLLKTN